MRSTLDSRGESEWEGVGKALRRRHRQRQRRQSEAHDEVLRYSFPFSVFIYSHRLFLCYLGSLIFTDGFDAVLVVHKFPGHTYGMVDMFGGHATTELKSKVLFHH